MSPLGKLLLTHCDNNLAINLDHIMEEYKKTFLPESAQMPYLRLLPKIRTTAIMLGLSIKNGS